MTPTGLKFPLVSLLVIGLGACDLPRGAALQSEVLKNADSETADFVVYPVTKSLLPTVASWPRTGGVRSYDWVGRTRGPASAVIAPGDTISITIWDSEENSLLTPPSQKVVQLQNVQVSPSGTVFVPYLDEVYIGNLTPDEARATLQSQLAAIVPSGQVQLATVPGRRNSVDLVSGVAAPGTYPMPDRDYTILSLISAGGGAIPTLRNPQVKLFRDGTNYGIALEKLFADPSLDTTLRGGDKVIVESDQRAFLSLGAAGEENVIYFPKDTITALEAATLVGGVNDARANPKGVLILREYGPKAVRSDGRGPEQARVIFTVDLTTADGLFSAGRFAINPGDLLFVTESPVTKAQSIFGIIGDIFGTARQAGSI